MQTKLFNSKQIPSLDEKIGIVDFLHEHLEQYGDFPEDIEKAIDHALSASSPQGGFVLTSYHEKQLSGAVVINRTGMEGYIPENILVYIATHKKLRGKGIGKELLASTIEIADGNIALHVDPDNRARFLYQKIGFENKYLEMRLIKK